MDGGSAVGVMLVAFPLCQIPSYDAKQRHKSVNCVMTLKSTRVMRVPKQRALPSDLGHSKKCRRLR
jgi:hypothetical protein